MQKIAIKEIKEIFEEGVSFHEGERILYSRDLSAPPKFVMRGLNTIPDAVVQPKSVNELKRLINVAAKHKIPLVPRGAGTAGYGGAIPTKGGIIVDFYRMNRIIEINPIEKTVTVEPGVVWNKLEAELNKHGLSLMVYPRSGLSSTVGGFVANGGGIGIGSFEYGSFRENIVILELVTPKGIKNLSGDDINFAFGMAGTTGFITKITFKVRDLEEDVPILAAFNNIDELTQTFNDIKERNLKLWTVYFKDRLHVKLTQKAIEEQQKRNPVPVHHVTEEKINLPEKYLATFAYPKSRDGVKKELSEIIAANGGEQLEEGWYEWNERFYPMRLKAIGPSLIASDVKIPTERLPELINEINQRINRDIAFEGMLAYNGRETVILTYVLDDERRRGFSLAYSLSLLPIKITKKLNGAPYTIGMYFTDDVRLCFDDIEKIYRFKEEVDPDGIMNPGKVFPSIIDKRSPIKRINRIIRIAKMMNKGLMAMDKLFRKVPTESTLFKDLFFGKETECDIFACSRCGYCRTECTLFNAVGWESASPRGKFYLLKKYIADEIVLDERLRDMFFVCATCERCNEVCQVNIPIEQRWDLTIRPMLLRDEKYTPPLLFRASIDNILTTHNPAGNPYEKRTEWLPEGAKYKEKGDIGYWAGCIASYNTKNIAENAIRILNKAGIEPVYLGEEEWCCGAPAGLVGRFNDIFEIIEHNINEINKRGIKKLIVSCGGCWVVLAQYYPIFATALKLRYDVKVEHIVETLSELIRKGAIKLKKELKYSVTYHDSCHIGRAGGIYEPPRKVLTSIPGLKLVEMERNRENAACCGRHTMRYPKLTLNANERVKEAEKTGASIIVANCPSCETNLRLGVRNMQSKLKIMDITDLVAESMEIPICDPEEFEKVAYKVYDEKQKPKIEEEKRRGERLFSI